MSIASAQRVVCEQHAAIFVASPPDSKLGFALTTTGKLRRTGLLLDSDNSGVIAMQRDRKAEYDQLYALYAAVRTNRGDTHFAALVWRGSSRTQSLAEAEICRGI